MASAEVVAVDADAVAAAAVAIVAARAKDVVLAVVLVSGGIFVIEVAGSRSSWWSRLHRG